MCTLLGAKCSRRVEAEIDGVKHCERGRVGGLASNTEVSGFSLAYRLTVTRTVSKHYYRLPHTTIFSILQYTLSTSEPLSLLCSRPHIDVQQRRPPPGSLAHCPKRSVISLNTNPLLYIARQHGPHSSLRLKYPYRDSSSILQAHGLAY